MPSIIFALLLCSALLRLAERVIPRDIGNSRQREQQEISAVLEDEDIEESESKELTVRLFSRPTPLEPRSRRRLFLIVVGCIVVRVETLRRTAQQIECTTKNSEVRCFSLSGGDWEIIHNTIDAFCDQKLFKPFSNCL